MDRALTIVEAIAFRKALRQTGKTVVFTNGLFDLLHVGHLEYLERARSLGDALFVGLNSDRSSQLLKGVGHPILVENDRARLLAALRPVDAVIIFDDLEASSLIQQLEPDIYVKGGDYAEKKWPEREIAVATGCRVELIAFLEGYSTTNLIEKILNKFPKNVASDR